MADYDNTNRGALFANTKKTKDTHPTHTGTINVNGVEYWLSAWVKESAAGKKYFSLSVKEKEDKGGAPAYGSTGSAFDPDEDIPF